MRRYGKFLVVKYGETIRHFKYYDNALKYLCRERKAKIFEINPETGGIKSWTRIVESH